MNAWCTGLCACRSGMYATQSNSSVASLLGKGLIFEKVRI